MKNTSRFVIIEELIVRDEKLLFTMVSYIATLMIFINLNFSLSPAIGTTASIIYLLINGAFLGRAFFEKEDIFVRLMLGILLLVAVLGILAWAMMIVYNLDMIQTTLALSVVTALCSFLNKRMMRKNAIY